jgi:hypothetical protein
VTVAVLVAISVLSEYVKSFVDTKMVQPVQFEAFGTMRGEISLILWTHVCETTYRSAPVKPRE